MLEVENCMLLGAGVVEHVVPFDDFFAFAAFGLAEGLFGLVELLPALPGGVVDVFGVEEVDDVGVGGVGEVAVVPVVDEGGGGFFGVGFGVADQADGSAFDPAGGVEAGDGGVVGVGDVGAVVGDDVVGVVEGDVWDGVGLVADGVVDGLDVPGGVFAGGLGVAGAVELGAFGGDGGDVAVGVVDFGGGFEEVDEEFVGSTFGFAHGVGFEGLADEVLGFGGVAGGDGGVVVVDVFGVDDDFDGVGVVEFFEFEWGEFGLGWAAASEDVDFVGLVGGECVVDVVGDFGGVEFVGGFGEDAGDVEGDVADADDGYLFGLEVPGALEVGVAVVEADEFAGAVGVFAAGDGQGSITGGAGGEDDGVVVVAEFVDGDVGADVDVGQEADVGFVHHVVEAGDDAFDAWVVWCDAVADEAEGGGHALVEVDGDVFTGFDE